MNNRFSESFGYKLIYIFRINDKAHNSLLKIGDATIETNDAIDKLPPNCKALNQAAKARINTYTNEACTHSYLTIGAFENNVDANNLLLYLKTKYVRFLILQSMSSIHITKSTFYFVPLQDFTENSDIDWSKSISEIDQQLYKKYNLTEEEIAFIESMIKPME